MTPADQRGGQQRASGPSPSNGVGTSLIALCQAGDHSALEELYLHYIHRIHAYLRIALGNDSDVQDVGQIVFASVLSALPRYRADGRPFEHWLLRIARNAAIDHARRGQRTTPHDPQELSRLREARQHKQPLPDRTWGGDAQLHAEIHRLPHHQRQIVVLRYLADMTVSEVGNFTDRTPSAVRQLHHRALRTLEARLAPG